MISDQNCTIQHNTNSITTLLHPFWNRPKTGLGQFKYFINTILSRFEIKFIHFLGGKNKSFGNKSCKICHMILHAFHLPAIWSVTLNKPWSLIGCFVFSVASSLTGKKMRFKAKNGAMISAVYLRDSSLGKDKVDKWEFCKLKITTIFVFVIMTQRIFPSKELVPTLSTSVIRGLSIHLLSFINEVGFSCQ